MNKFLAAGLLSVNLIRDLFVSGWNTALIILNPHAPTRAGFVQLAYGDLSEVGAQVLGTLITLTPGTTFVDINAAKRQLLLHVLDLDASDATLAAIRRDFMRPIRVLFGTRS